MAEYLSMTVQCKLCHKPILDTNGKNIHIIEKLGEGIVDAGPYHRKCCETVIQKMIDKEIERSLN